MRTIPIAVAALTLMSAAAFAQTTPSSPSRPTSPSPGATMAPAKPAPAINPLTQEDISNIQGQTVYGSDDAKIGHVSNVLMDPKSKQVDRLVVAAGGVLGIGSHRVAIPVDQFSWDGERSIFKLTTKDVAALKSMPEWVEGATATATGTTQPPKKPASTGSGDGDSK
jgi:sporulation protein YlmC with PRC-barrel domain